MAGPTGLTKLEAHWRDPAYLKLFFLKNKHRYTVSIVTFTI